MTRLTSVPRGSVDRGRAPACGVIVLWLGCALAVTRAWPLGAQTPLSFRDALTMAQQQNQQLRAAEAQVERSRATRSATRGLYFPTISANGLYAHMNDRLFVDLEGLRPILSSLNPAVPIPPLTATVLENDPYRTGLTAHWTLFAGGSILAQNRGAQAGVTAAEQEHRLAEHGITTELVDRYFKRRLAADVLEVRRRALETLTRHLEDARRLRAAGQIARTDELRAEVSQAEADREFKKARRDVELASVALRSTLGNQVDAVPSTPLVLITGLEPLATFSQAADSGNPAIGRLAALKEQARQGAVAARGELFPSIAAFGGYEFFQKGLNSTADPKWIVGVGARWELFDGFGRLNRLRSARHLEEALGFEHDHAQHEVATLVQQRYDEYQSALEQYQSLETTLALAQESLRSEQKAYTAGVGTSLDVTDAQLSLSRAQVDRLTALYDLDLAVARLLEASGESGRFLEYLDRATPAEELR
ncbi:MAG TPA: TolC family protein [Gemmatimonadales bacterium]|nr:TolC family protein [Gemmatimonadales bacterium]